MKKGHVSGTEDSRNAGPEHVHPLLLPTGVYLPAEVDVGPGLLVKLVAIKQQCQDVNSHGAVGVQVLQILWEALHQLWSHQGHSATRNERDAQKPSLAQGNSRVCAPRAEIWDRIRTRLLAALHRALTSVQFLLQKDRTVVLTSFRDSWWVRFRKLKV